VTVELVARELPGPAERTLLVVHGGPDWDHGRQDMTFPAALAERTAALLPGATAVVLDEAGHMAHVDQPECWLAALSAFLDRPVPGCGSG
jgi:hypothetical protein